MKRKRTLVIERVAERTRLQIETWEDDHRSDLQEKQSNSESGSSDSSEIVPCEAQHKHENARFPAQAGFLSTPNSITGKHNEPSQ